MESRTSHTTLHANHVGITVSSVDDALAFWNQALGLKTMELTIPSADREDELTETLSGVKGAKVKVAHVEVTPGFVVELIEYTSPPAEKGVTIKSKPNLPGTMHLNLQVKGLDGILEKGRQLGWKMVDEAGIVTLPDDGPGLAGTRVVYLQGPNQEMVELVEVPQQTQIHELGVPEDVSDAYEKGNKDEPIELE
ncbi:hypothetical protein ASPCADRAFT_508555 [Aspergillus carbonarius ITEM 5010]|uniref:VOC domain-containing protein n=1 Tax=Aspergillus carbonarius (strain ITEM 5010) TaxID=602072 RepID=A0A1R3RG18_ASPC5|nr:hypothetical protein ASPCADRAFT_508555 [Aspergillus carbonarius ITEM 5010]